MRSRLAADTAYAVACLWAFTYQTPYPILDSLSGTSDAHAFEPSDFPLPHGMVAPAILGVGLALVESGHRTARRRRVRREWLVPA